MQIVIEIADDDYNRINSYPDGKTFYPITARLYKAVKDGIPIPNNATNGDVLEIIFPKIGAYDEWYDAPYQKGGKE